MNLYQYFNYDNPPKGTTPPPLYELRLRYIFGPTFFASFVYL